jgi:hypothetical protein
MTFLYAIAFVIANFVGGTEVIEVNPVNGWALALLIVVACDLSAARNR